MAYLEKLGCTNEMFIKDDFPYGIGQNYVSFSCCEHWCSFGLYAFLSPESNLRSVLSDLSLKTLYSVKSYNCDRDLY